jgi:hypothetical protein
MVYSTRPPRVNGRGTTGFQRRMWTCLAPMLALVWGCGLGVLQAQVTADEVRRINSNLANDAVNAVEIFSAANTIGAGTFNYDNPGPNDVEFKTYKLPFGQTFGAATNRTRAFWEGHFGYFTLDQEVSSFGPPPGHLEIDSLTAAGGGGVTWKAAPWLSISPRFLLAYSHVWQDYQRDTPPGTTNANYILDWQAGALTLLPSLEAVAARSLGRWDLSLSSRYTYLRVLGLYEDTDLIELDSGSHVWRTEAKTGFRSPWKVFDLSLRPYGLFAFHEVSGQIDNSGFVDYFFEGRLGVGFGVPGKRFAPLREVDFSFAYYFKEPLTGYSLGLSFGF